MLPDQIAADHSPLDLRFSHLIKIKPLSPMNSLIKIKPLLSINIKPLPHKARLNGRRSLSPQSPFFSFDQDQTIVVDELTYQDQTTTTDQHQTTATQSLIKSSPVNSLISRCLISGFRVGWVMIWLSN